MSNAVGMLKAEEREGWRERKDLKEKVAEELAERYNSRSYLPISWFAFTDDVVEIDLDGDGRREGYTVWQLLNDDKELFVSFVRKVYELQGKKKGEIEAAGKLAGEWWDAVRKAIQGKGWEKYFKWNGKLQTGAAALYLLAQNMVGRRVRYGMLYTKNLEEAKGRVESLLKAFIGANEKRYGEYLRYTGKERGKKSVMEMRAEMYSDRGFTSQLGLSGGLLQSFYGRVREVVTQVKPEEERKEKEKAERVDERVDENTVVEKQRGAERRRERRKREVTYLVFTEEGSTEEKGAYYMIAKCCDSYWVMRVEWEEDIPGRVKYRLTRSYRAESIDEASDLFRKLTDGVKIEYSEGPLPGLHPIVMRGIFQEGRTSGSMPLKELESPPTQGGGQEEIGGEGTKDKEITVEDPLSKTTFGRWLKNVMEAVERGDVEGAMLAIDTVLASKPEGGMTELEEKIYHHLEKARGYLESGNTTAALQELEKIKALIKGKSEEELAKELPHIMSALTETAIEEVEERKAKETFTVSWDRSMERVERLKLMYLAALYLKTISNNKYPPDEFVSWIKEELEREGEGLLLISAGANLPKTAEEARERLEEMAKDVEKIRKVMEDLVGKGEEPTAEKVWEGLVGKHGEERAREIVEGSHLSTAIAALTIPIIEEMGNSHAIGKLYAIEEIRPIKGEEREIITREDLAKTLEESGHLYLGKRVREGFVTDKELEEIRKVLIEEGFDEKSVNAFVRNIRKRPALFLRKDQTKLLGREGLKKLEGEGAVKEVKAGKQVSYLVIDWDKVEKALEEKEQELPSISLPTLEEVLVVERAYGELANLNRETVEYLLGVGSDLELFSLINELSERYLPQQAYSLKQ